jgi:hypothetical protein
MKSKCEGYGTDMGLKWGETVLVEASAPSPKSDLEQPTAGPPSLHC